VAESSGRFSALKGPRIDAVQLNFMDVIRRLFKSHRRRLGLLCNSIIDKYSLEFPMFCTIILLGKIDKNTSMKCNDIISLMNSSFNRGLSVDREWGAHINPYFGISRSTCELVCACVVDARNTSISASSSFMHVV